MSSPLGYIPEWPLPANVGAFVSYRSGGRSEGPYCSNNLGTHVGDDSAAVAFNRDQLNQHLGIKRPYWLEQVHGTRVVKVAEADHRPQADASIGDRPGEVCAVLTADCLPLLICDRYGYQVAAVHCGWRGLADGIIARALAAFSVQAQDILTYMGPAISSRHYEVGEEVRDALASTVAVQSDSFSHAVSGKPGHYLLDLYAVARAQLTEAGVHQIFGGGRCSFAEADAFFSYRRDGVTGRMASLIWLK